MPHGAVKTPEQEVLWEKAKLQAEKQGQKDNFAYIMAIYKNMGGLNKTAMEDIFMEKTAKVGFIGRVLGKNVGIAKKELGSALKDFQTKKSLLRNKKVQSGFKLGPLDFRKETPLYNKSEIRKILSSDMNKLQDLRTLKKLENKETFNARVKGALGLGGLAAATPYLKDKIVKGKYTYPQETYTEETIANSVVHGLLKEASIKNKTLNFLKGVKDIGTFKGYSAAKQNLKNIEKGVNPTYSLKIKELIGLKRSIKNLSGKNEELKKQILREKGLDENSVSRTIIDRIKDGNDVLNAKSRRAKDLENLYKGNQDIIGTANNKYQKEYNKFVDVKDRELSKSLGLWSIPTVGALYGGKKILDKRKEKGSP